MVKLGGRAVEYDFITKAYFDSAARREDLSGDLRGEPALLSGLPGAWPGDSPGGGTERKAGPGNAGRPQPPRPLPKSVRRPCRLQHLHSDLDRWRIPSIPTGAPSPPRFFFPVLAPASAGSAVESGGDPRRGVRWRRTAGIVQVGIASRGRRLTLAEAESERGRHW